MKFYFVCFFFFSFFLFAQQEQTILIKDKDKIIFTKDSEGRLIKRQIKDKNERTIFLEKLKYDDNGNLLEIKNGFYRKENWKTQVTRFFYNQKNQLLEIIRGFGNENERKTTFKYDEKGNVVQKTNPNGVKIHYVYDSLRSSIQSSDGTVDYVVLYNDRGEWIKTEDKINHQIILG